MNEELIYWITFGPIVALLLYVCLKMEFYDWWHK